jgi:hypothetical protein
MTTRLSGQVMVTGWFFNYFPTHDTAIGMTTEQARARCFETCHRAQEARDYVFSDPRR